MLSEGKGDDRQTGQVVVRLGFVFGEADLGGRSLLVDFGQDLEVARVLERARQQTRIDEISLADALIAVVSQVDETEELGDNRSGRAREVERE